MLVTRHCTLLSVDFFLFPLKSPRHWRHTWNRITNGKCKKKGRKIHRKCNKIWHFLYVFKRMKLLIWIGILFFCSFLYLFSSLFWTSWHLWICVFMTRRFYVAHACIQTGCVRKSLEIPMLVFLWKDTKRCCDITRLDRTHWRCASHWSEQCCDSIV